jgi:F-type H+-transporting ATPase subunit delta
MTNQPTASKSSNELPSAVNLDLKDMARLETDLEVAVQVLGNDNIRAFFADSRIMRKGKLVAFRQIIEPRVHPVMTHFLMSLVSAGGIRGLASREGGFEPKHYAAACIELAGDTGCLARIAQDLVLADSVMQMEQVRAFLAIPVVHKEGKCTALKQLLAGRVHPLVIFLVLFLFWTHELAKFPAIAAICLEEIAERTQGVAGEVISAFPISQNVLADIEREAGRLLGKRLKLNVRIDTSILGGIVVKAGDFVLDGTVDHQLESIRQSLLATSSPDA